MRIRDCNWMQVEEYLKRDDRAVLPLGSTEQHAYLSLSVDSILSEQVAVEAAEPLGVPVFPAMPYGPTPSFMAYPGTVSLRLQSYLAVVRDVLESIAAHGFRRIVIVNGHGGNQPVSNLASEWMGERPLGSRCAFTTARLPRRRQFRRALPEARRADGGTLDGRGGRNA